jgi:hypothetical protein
MDNDHQRWLWQQWGQKCVANLKKNGFEAELTDTPDQARDRVVEWVQGCESFGFGGSATVRALGLIGILQAKGKTIYDHWQPGVTKEQDRSIRLAQGRCDCFLCSANAISLTGEIVNVDGIGNRTAAMSFGPRKVIIAAGMNKVTADLEAALRRIRQVAAPLRARSLNMATPCAETGICSDCHAPQRICRITTILHRRPSLTDVAVVLINAAMGF